MPSDSILYQTLENRDNPDKIEDEGPFKCVKKSAWLGHGYYFWDYHIELSHWWGEKIYGEDNYIICKCNCNITEDNCWDLHNNGKHRKELYDALSLIIKTKIVKKAETITVAQIIEYAKRKGFFNHEAIRIQGINSAQEITDTKNINVGSRVRFKKDNYAAYYDIFPAIQLCLLTKFSLSLKDYEIVYPSYLIEDSVF